MTMVSLDEQERKLQDLLDSITRLFLEHAKRRSKNTEENRKLAKQTFVMLIHRVIYPKGANQ